jgi:hypothetical protein
MISLLLLLFFAPGLASLTLVSSILTLMPATPARKWLYWNDHVQSITEVYTRVEGHVSDGEAGINCGQQQNSLRSD